MIMPHAPGPCSCPSHPRPFGAPDLRPRVPTPHLTAPTLVPMPRPAPPPTPTRSGSQAVANFWMALDGAGEDEVVKAQWLLEARQLLSQYTAELFRYVVRAAALRRWRTKPAASPGPPPPPPGRVRPGNAEEGRTEGAGVDGDDE